MSKGLEGFPAGLKPELDAERGRGGNGDGIQIGEPSQRPMAAGRSTIQGPYEPLRQWGCTTV